MARGFWTGLVHGGAVGIAALAILAIVVPVARDPHRLVPDPASAPRASGAQSPQSVPPPESGRDRVPAAAGDDGTGPEAPPVDLPVGSEFARGGDVAPFLPAPLAMPPDRSGQSEAPAVSAPAAEPAPVAVMADMGRPEAISDGAGQLPPVAPDIVEAPEFDHPAVLGLPEQPRRPGFAGGSDADALPPESPLAERPTADTAPVSGENSVAGVLDDLPDDPVEGVPAGMITDMIDVLPADSPADLATAMPADMPIDTDTLQPAQMAPVLTLPEQDAEGAPDAPVDRPTAPGVKTGLDLSLPPGLAELLPSARD